MRSNPITFITDEDKSLVAEKLDVNEVSCPEVYASLCSRLAGADAVRYIDARSEYVHCL